MLPGAGRQGSSLAGSLLLPAAGQYIVELFFMELYWSAAGERVFDLDINGLPALRCFDIWQQAGGGKRSLVVTFLARARARSQWLSAPKAYPKGYQHGPLLQHAARRSGPAMALS